MASDASVLLDLLCDPAVTEHVSAPPCTISAFEGFIAWSQQERARSQGVCFGIVPHGLESAVGIIQIRALEPTWFTAEWGFAIGASFWSTGAFLDAAYLVARFAFETMHVYRIEARAVEMNGRGNGALQKLGAKPEGALASAFKRNDRYEAQLLWALTAEDLQQRTLVSERFSVLHTRKLIAAAIADVRDRLDSNKSTPSPHPAPLYPFFLTHSAE